MIFDAFVKLLKHELVKACGPLDIEIHRLRDGLVGLYILLEGAIRRKTWVCYENITGEYSAASSSVFFNIQDPKCAEKMADAIIKSFKFRRIHD